VSAVPHPPHQPYQPLRRAVNEQVHHLTQFLGLEDAETIPVLCECTRTECTSRIEVPVQEYEAVRDRTDRFIVGPHHVGDGDTVLERRGEYVLVAGGGRS
jgi:hypothetical protein